MPKRKAPASNPADDVKAKKAAAYDLLQGISAHLAAAKELSAPHLAAAREKQQMLAKLESEIADLGKSDGGT